METPPTRKYKKHKEGYTISVTYYLRKENAVYLVPGIPNSTKHEPLYLYMRVAFLGQNVKIRSRLRATLTEDNFNDYMERPDVKAFVEVETAAIKHSVHELNPVQIADFRISQWSAYYYSWDISLFDCIQVVVSDRLKHTLQSNFDLSEQEKALHITTSGGLQSLKFLATLTIHPAVVLYSQLQPLHDILNVDDTLFGTEWSGPKYSFWDWKSGLYSNHIRNIHGDKSEVFLSLLGELLSTYANKKAYETKGI